MEVLWPFTYNRGSSQQYVFRCLCPTTMRERRRGTLVDDKSLMHALPSTLGSALCRYRPSSTRSAGSVMHVSLCQHGACVGSVICVRWSGRRPIRVVPALKENRSVCHNWLGLAHIYHSSESERLILRGKYPSYLSMQMIRFRHSVVWASPGI